MKLFGRKSLLLITASLAMLVAACAPQAGAVLAPTEAPTATPAPTEEPTTAPTVSHGNPIGGVVELIDALREAGATVEPGDEIEQAFFSVKAQIIKVDGADVQVFEYAGEQAREAESSQISPDGQPSPTTMVTWVDQPNFWAGGRLIVLYVGADESVIEHLTNGMGEPLAQGEAPMSDRTYPPAVLAAIQALSTEQGISADQIHVVSFEAVDWPDSCLGIHEPGILCAQVITPGYLVILEANGQEVEVHTNADGTAVRIK